MGNIVNRVFDSSGPEGKVRGTPQQIIDKYNQLARDAQLSNDRVAFENFQQHAEHYTRMLGEAMREQEQFRQQNEGGRQSDDRDGQPRDQRRDEDRGDRGERQDRGDRNDRDRTDDRDRNDRDRSDDRSDRDRNERDRPDDRDRGEDRFDPPRFLQARTDDVIDVADDDEKGGLVETPEAAASAPADDAPRPPRRRRARKGGGEGGEGQPDVKPEAAE
jgi:hypothetical protein